LNPVTDRWFVGDGIDRPGRPRIVCFPHAGGRAGTFASWQTGLDDAATVLAVRMPGREGRLDETAPQSVDDYADAAAKAVYELGDRPVVLFGHSLGAVVAFETARRLSNLGAPPQHLAVSGCAAPPLLPSARVRQAAALQGRQFAEAVAWFGGLPRDVVDDEDLREILLPGLIADFRMVADYRYRPGTLLRVPLTVIGATSDPHVDEVSLERWHEVVDAAPRQYLVDGDHFYFNLSPVTATGILCAVVGSGGQHVELI